MTTTAPSEFSETTINPKVVLLLEKFAAFANVVLFIVPALVLIGWILGIETLKRVLPDMIEMNPFSAIHFILLGLALRDARRDTTKSHVSLLRIVTCGAVAFFGARMECKYLFGWETNMDRLLFPGSIGTNRMAPNTAADFVFISLALLFLDVKIRRFRPAQILCLLVGLSALLALIGYSYGVGKLFGIGRYAPMALHVAFCFLLLSLATLCTRPAAGLMARVSSDGAGGAVLRRLLFWLVAMPLLGGWLILSGARNATYDTSFGFTLFVVLVIVFVTVMIWINAASLDQKDRERNRAESSLRRGRDELEVRVQERVGDLAKVMSEVRDAVSLLTESSADIVRSSAALTAGATDAAGAVAETLTTMEELRQTAQLSNQQASLVQSGAREAEGVTERGEKSALTAKQAVGRIREQMEMLAERTLGLGDQIKSIGEIMATLDDLAQQTNVLAINATIEAVKANEHGRGFAVVAREVRALAAQSQSATTQVRAILREINKANLAAMDAAKESRASVEAGAREFGNTGDSISLLTHHLARSAEAAVQISASIEQQAGAIDQVTSAIRLLHTASEENAQTAQQLESAAQRLNTLGERLQKLSASIQI